ncbi:MAG: hypothetical protein PHW96_04145 [Candidatus Nanoarchaeia archaeon]|nr:hypothetical protein [Candidatus Nanoarchaeia archaeon]
MQNKHNTAYEFVKSKGAVLPSNVAKEIETDVFTSNAILYELVSKGLIKKTFGKIGDSSIYYVSEQELKALGMVYNNLSEVFKKLVNELKDYKVILDEDLDPRRRVLYGRISDFALKGSLTVNGKEHVFWRYFAIPDERAKELVQNTFSSVKETKKPDVVEEVKHETITELAPEIKEPRTEKKEEKSKPLMQKTSGAFIQAIEGFLGKKNMTVIKKTDLGKSEANFIVEVPTAFGPQKFFVKAKNKKSITKTDLSVAWAEASRYNLPSIFLTNGKISKLTKEFQESNMPELFRVVRLE